MGKEDENKSDYLGAFNELCDARNRLQKKKDRKGERKRERETFLDIFKPSSRVYS